VREELGRRGSRQDRQGVEEEGTQEEPSLTTQQSSEDVKKASLKRRERRGDQLSAESPWRGAVEKEWGQMESKKEEFGRLDSLVSLILCHVLPAK